MQSQEQKKKDLLCRLGIHKLKDMPTGLVSPFQPSYRQCKKCGVIVEDWLGVG